MRRGIAWWTVVVVLTGTLVPLPGGHTARAQDPAACVSSTEVLGVVGGTITADGGAAAWVQRWEGDDRRLGIVRLLPDGRVDLTHGSSGEVVLGFPRDREPEIHQLVADDRGGVIVVAQLSYPSGIATLRLEADGRVDPSWPVRLVEGHGQPRADSVLDAQGRLLVAVADGVLRLRTGGSMDPAYGAGGLAALPGLAASMAAVGDELVVVATRQSFDATFSRLWRLDASGQIDTGWGEDGDLILQQTPSTRLPTALGSRILVHISRGAGGTALLALDPTGQPDPTFGSDGEVVLPAGMWAMAVAVTGIDPSVLLRDNEGRHDWQAITGSGVLDGSRQASQLGPELLIEGARAVGDGARAFAWVNDTVAIARFRAGCSGPDGPAPPIPPPAEGVRRLSGPDRFATAAEVSRVTYPSADVVVLATGATFPDALAGGPLAAAIGGPVLLTTREQLTDPTRTELVRLRARRAIVLGGDAAVSGAVLAELTELGITAERVAGPDRFATAAAVSRAAFPDGAEVAIVATGQDAPDALAGAAIGARIGAPVLLVAKGAIPAPTRVELDRLGVRQVHLLGGQAAVSSDVESQLWTDDRVVSRLGGESRFGTAALAATEILGIEPDHQGTAPPQRVFLATGLNFPDALAAGAAAAAVDAPLLLVAPDTVPEPTRRALAQIAPLEITLLGGQAAITDSVGRQASDRAVTGWVPFEALGDSRAARWNACAPVAWAFNPDGAPEGALAVVQEVMASAATASGLDLRYVGTTDAGVGPSASEVAAGRDEWLPLRVGWTEDMSEEFVGIGGFTYDTGTGTISTGIAGIRPLGDGLPASAYRGTLLHEVGHALGLGHVNDPNAAMYPFVSDTVAYSAGDRLGLRTLGVDGGCAPPPAPPSAFLNDRSLTGRPSGAGVGRMWCHLPQP